MIRCTALIGIVLALLAAGGTAPEAQRSPAVSWAPLPLPFPTSQPLRSVWLYEPDSRITFVGEDGKGLFKSADGGITWTRADNGSFKVEDVNPDAHSLTSDRFGRLYALVSDRGGTRIFTSPNFGRRWLPLWPASRVAADRVQRASGGAIGWARQLFVSPRNASEMLLLTWQPAEESSLVRHRIWATGDSWRHYSRVGLDADPQAWTEIDGIAASRSTICIVKDSHLLCTRNKGQAWEDTSFRVGPGANLTDRLFLDNDDELAVFADDGVYQSRNGRTTFTRVSSTRAGADVEAAPGTVFPAFFVEIAQPRWRVCEMSREGRVACFDGPIATGFRLRAVDLFRQVAYVWTAEGFFRGHFERANLLPRGPVK